MLCRGISPHLSPPPEWIRERSSPKPYPRGEVTRKGADEGGIPPKAFPMGGRWPEGADEGAMIARFRSLQGDFAACGRRTTLPMAAK